MQEFKIIPKYTYGERLGCRLTKRIGEVIKIYPTLIKIDDYNYKTKIAYTLRPDKKYNQFKVAEENIGEVVSDYETGEEYILPEDA
jgi:hypothetical protein